MILIVFPIVPQFPGIDKIEKEINNDENLKNTIETLKKKINPQG